MARRKTLIVQQLDSEARNRAAAEGITELIVGIPRRLRDELAGVELPYVYEEPEPVVDRAQDDEFVVLRQLLGPDWAGSETAWAGLTAAQKAEHLRLRSNALRNGLLWLYRYTTSREVE